METREQQVSATLVELADTLVPDYDLFEFLDLLLSRTMALVGAAGGGVMLRGDRDELEPLASSSEEMLLLELLELQRREGPCIDSYATGQQVIETEPCQVVAMAGFAPAMVERGYRSTLAIPLRLRGR
jgi:hypothetical protein